MDQDLKTDMPDMIPQAFQVAWNMHDMAAFGALFCKDAAFVNRFGHYVRGVAEIIAMHLPIHETIYRDSTLENELIETKLISDDIAIVHFWSRLNAGFAHPAGMHKVDTLIQAVLVKQHGGWLIQTLENVTLADPKIGTPLLRGQT